MKIPRTYLPLITLFSGFALGIGAGQSWLQFFGTLVGFLLAVIMGITWHVIDRRKKRKASRLPLVRLLDKMTRLVEETDRSLLETVYYNAEHPRDSTVTYVLQLCSGTVIYHLQAETISTGKHAGWMKVRVAVHDEKERRSAVDYPDIVGWAAPEPWLTERIERLRDLVGTASAYEARKARLTRSGVEVII